jgi:aminopeptidase N
MPKVLLCIALTLTLSPLVAEETFLFDSTPGTLPKDIVPRHYTIEVRPDVGAMKTRGTETITFEVRRETKQIVLNAIGTKIERTSLKSASGEEQLLTARNDEEAQTVTFPISNKLSPGTYELSLEFTSSIEQAAQGLHVQHYKVDGDEKTLLATEMEPSDARRMFPCWDEPAFRASFQIACITSTKNVAISNMPVTKEESLPNGEKRVQFAVTPAMATYLVALFCGEFEKISDYVGTTALNVYTVAGKSQRGKFALEAAKKVLPYYEAYFNQPYPLPKLDQIFVPGESDSMENWGAIKDEEKYLVDPSNDSWEDQSDAFQSLVHEIAHQWFGNLVTMAWWDNLWLNESFATWMQKKATDQFHPEWKIWINALAEKESAMDQDAVPASRPIHRTIKDPAQAFDSIGITYSKGMTVLRMFEEYLGPDAFRDGIRRYLAAHQYSNATGTDFWTALEQGIGKPVRRISASWIDLAGYPIVSVDRTGRHLTVSQTRFVYDKSQRPRHTWSIPIGIEELVSIPRAEYWLLEKPTEKLTLSNLQLPMIANSNGIGYYRVAYAPSLLAKLCAIAATLSEEDRFTLVNDCWSTIELGRTDGSALLRLMTNLIGDRSPLVCGAMWSVFSTIDRLEPEKERTSFREFARSVFRPMFDVVGWTPQRGESQDTAKLRSDLIWYLCALGDEQIRQEGCEQFEHFLRSPEALDANLRRSVFSCIATAGSNEEYEKLKEIALYSTNAIEVENAVTGLASTSDPERLNAVLDWALQGHLSASNAVHLAAQSAQLSAHPGVVWSFWKGHRDELLRIIPVSDHSMVVDFIAENLSDTRDADEVRRFSRTALSAGARPKLEETAQKILHRNSLKERVIPKLNLWIQENSKTSARSW